MSRNPIHVDICVVGAGFAGLAAAEAAVAQGATVAIVEATHRAGGRARTIHPRTARLEGRDARAAVSIEAGPEFVDEAHRLLRDACARTGVTMRPVRGGASAFVDGVIIPGGPRPTPDEQRFEHAYGDLLDEIAAGIADVGHPERHGEVARHDARSVADVLDDAEAQIGAAPLARQRIERFSQGVLGADPTAVSALFMAQQSLLDGGGGSARVEQGLGTVAARLLDRLATRATVLVGHRVEHLSWDDAQVQLTVGHATVNAGALVLAVPLGALLAIDAHPALPEPWLAAARSLRYGSLTKTSLVAPGVEIPGWAIMSELPSGLLWQAQPGMVTTYVGGARSEALVERRAPEVIAQAAADVSRVVGHEVKPDGVTWRWSPRARRGGCYVVFGPGQVGAHWADVRRSIGPLALAGEHAGTFCGYVEGAMESGVAATTALLTRTQG